MLAVNDKQSSDNRKEKYKSIEDYAKLESQYGMDGFE